MNRKVIILLLFTLVGNSYCQSKDADSLRSETPSLSSNLLYFEVGGNAGYLSINYEHVLLDHFSCRLGFGGHQFDIDKTSTFAASGPVFVALLNYVIVRYFSYFEVGLGADMYFDKKYLGKDAFFHRFSYLIPTGRIGGALASESGGVAFIFAYTPFFDFHPLAMRSFLSLGIGLAFD
ncbi:MAG: hypothetical protein Q8916_09390 [Bacteroidota bacterium]|nr:hypothetical protein [Bacteroidota bacterium]MDP4230601.1 hypothetical protein [Bacteroidota bacterium]MDP4235692.1 hypothetical protein [Bacteroidota bacterium]